LGKEDLAWPKSLQWIFSLYTKWVRLFYNKNKGWGMKNSVIPVMDVNLKLGPGLLPYLSEIQTSRKYSNFGPQVIDLQAQYAELFGVSPDCVSSCSNATIGLMGAMAILNADSWIIPSWSFSATAHAATAISEKIFFGDVDSGSWILKPDHVKKSRGAVVTAPFGSQIEIGKEWNRFNGLVIDAAAAIASPPKISKDLTIPWVTVYSLHATKILGIGEGSVAVFSTPELARQFRIWSNFGFTGVGSDARQSQFKGTNGKLSEVHAAIGRYRLSTWSQERKQWLESRELTQSVSDSLNISPSFSTPNWISPYWIVQFSSREIKLRIREALGLEGVETRDWWESGCHSMPAFKRIRKLDQLTNTENIASTSLGLPFGPNVRKSQVDKIAQIIEKFL
jgi:dTDP-4-amino-4,6-dideoxygalactose transaminase